MSIRFAAVLAVHVLLIPRGNSEQRVFTDTTGREIRAELKAVEGEQVTIHRSDGRTFTLPLDRFSEADREFVAAWKKSRTAEQEERDAAETAKLLAIERRRSIADFCRNQHRKQVGNGECWTLANEAFHASGAVRPGEDSRVWGKEVDYTEEPLEAGDIVEFRTAKIPGYGITGEMHTAVVIRGGGNGRCTLAEQNWGGVKKVRHVQVNLAALVSGTVTVYRPE